MGNPGVKISAGPTAHLGRAAGSKSQHGREEQGEGLVVSGQEIFCVVFLWAWGK